MAKYNDITMGQMEACVNRLGGMQEFLSFIGGKGRIVWENVLSTVYTFIVDYTRPLSEAIAAGGYDWVNEHITESNFPKPAQFASVQQAAHAIDHAELLHFNRYISSEDAVVEMDKLGFRPATIWELLAFGAKYPELQRSFPIVALGSVCEVGGDRRVAYLDRFDSERYLYLNWWHGGWDDDCRFLAVRK